MKKVPTAILNPDVIPGRANQYLMRYTRHVCCQFEQTAEHVPREHRKKIDVTGCPIRRQIFNLPPRAEAQQRLGLDKGLITLVITGASLGAQTINEAVLEMLKDHKLQGWQILHLAGREHALKVREGYRELEVDARVIDFTPAMADVWAVADLCVSRSGASSCAELTACGVPSILMRHELYVTAALFAAGLFVALASGGVVAPWPAMLGFGLGFMIRAAAIRWSITLPPHRGH